MGIKWVDNPPEPRPGRPGVGRPKYYAFAEALKEAARAVGCPRNRVVRARTPDRGGKTVAFQPAGTFEAVSRKKPTTGPAAAPSTSATSETEPTMSDFDPGPGWREVTEREWLSTPIDPDHLELALKWQNSALGPVRSRCRAVADRRVHRHPRRVARRSARSG
jgi:hypothetical protein